MACNGVLTFPQQKYTPPQIGNASQSWNILLPPPPPVLKLFTLPIRLEMAASVFFTHGYLQQAHIHISEAIITD